MKTNEPKPNCTSTFNVRRSMFHVLLTFSLLLPAVLLRHAAHAAELQVDPLGRMVCDTGAAEGLVMWATDILIDVRIP